MKLIDEKGKLLGAINIIDLLIMIFAAIVVAVVVMFFSANSSITEAEKKSIITIEAISAEKVICDSIKLDTEIFDRIQNKPLGKLVDKRIVEAEEYNISVATGEHVKTEVPQRYNIELDIEASTGEDLYVGKRMSVETKDFMVTGYIIKKEID